MTDRPHPDPTPDRPSPVDDATIGAIIREVADDWRMPPQRLDAPTWHDRIGPGPGRVRRSRRWLGRLAGAATLAVVATVGLSLVAVWLTLPRGQSALSGRSSSPSLPALIPAATPTPLASPLPGPLPKLSLTGALPSPTRILMRVGGGYAIADLATGTLSPRFADSQGAADLHVQPDGTFDCLCVATDAIINGAFSHAVVTLRTFDATGTPTGSRPVTEFSGVPDPRPGIVADQPPHVDVAVSYSADGRLGYVGWSARQPPVWKNGVLVVDLANGAVVQRLSLPGSSIGPDDGTVNTFAPSIRFAPDGQTALLSRPSYWISRPGGQYRSRVDHFLVAISDGRLGAPATFAAGQACAAGEGDAGFAPNGSSWLVCWSDTGGASFIRRLTPDGTKLGDTQIDATIDGSIWTATRDGSALYFWNPTTRTVTRVDLLTGQAASRSAPAPSAGGQGDVLAAIGRWIAPAASAKVFLQPGIVLSPDGTRLYALGVAGSGAGGFIGSSGVFVFDARSLAPLANWAPLADYVSVAASSDGRYVYAAGQPGVDTTGQLAKFGSSITVYDASDGSVRLIAGQLDYDDLQFLAPTLP